jgi:HEAT repeat protein
MRRAAGTLAVAMLCAALSAAHPSAQAPSAAQIETAIGRLGSFEFDVRTEAARLLRRAPADAVVPALAAAARSHRDEYVRYRALVLLSGFGGPPAAAAMDALKTDRNDRLRTVAFSWYAHHPDPAVLPTMLAEAEKEHSEFVRPALTRALAALAGKDPRARAALRPLVMRGEDFFRGAVIDALGDYGGAYALPDIVEVAKLDGPLQDDAISAIGKLGDRSLVPVLGVIQTSAPPELQPTIAAALCLLGEKCAETDAYLVQVLRFGASAEGQQPLVRGAAHALGLLASRGRASALAVLLDRGVPAFDPVRSPLALAAGLVALRDPMLLLTELEKRPDRQGVVELLRDAFDMLAEDFEEERFYVQIRRAYWAAPDGSPRRDAARLLIELLEF